MTWLYESTPDNHARFVLGTVGENPLICFGVNPSTAEPGSLDPTLRTVARVAAATGYDSWIMLNVYPQRATNPRDMHRDADAELATENALHISRVVAGRPLTLWAAWGGLIETRPYLREQLRGIIDLPELSTAVWVSRGPNGRAGHPHHPLYVRAEATFAPYSVTHYR